SPSGSAAVMSWPAQLSVMLSPSASRSSGMTCTSSANAVGTTRAAPASTARTANVNVFLAHANLLTLGWRHARGTTASAWTAVLCALFRRPLRPFDLAAPQYLERPRMRILPRHAVGHARRQHAERRTAEETLR